ncbi:MAG: FtsQ-type POTRA domain-containing protein [Caldiserica bacterium]|nr:FtsQ-type POTRA domain-containing protein [Caldisericota bacterium]
MLRTFLRWTSLAAAVWLLALAVVRFSGWLQVQDIRIIVVNDNGASEPEHLSPQEVMNLTGIRYKANIAKLKVADARKRLEQLPWVKEARIERFWLRGIVEIRIRERKPVGRVQGEGGKAYSVDGEGVVLGPAAEADTSPIVLGLPLSLPEEDVPPQVTEILRVYQNLPYCSELYPTVDAHDVDDVRLLPSREAFPPIRLGPLDRVPGTLPKVEAVLDWLAREGAGGGFDPTEFVEIDCRLGDGCVLKPSVKGG